MAASSKNNIMKSMDDGALVVDCERGERSSGDVATLSTLTRAVKKIATLVVQEQTAHHLLDLLHHAPDENKVILMISPP